jgi:acid phosphatase family membrane protein YuiD
MKGLDILYPTCIALIVAQFIKNTIFFLKNKKFDFRLLFGTGGMPSGHAATVAALTAATGKSLGWDSPLFAITLVVSIIIMCDAANVRRAAGQQAKVLNMMLEDLYKEGKIKEERLKELLGHTPIEVIAGCILGILIGVTL